jgi:hypothetical protein
MATYPNVFPTIVIDIITTDDVAPIVFPVTGAAIDTEPPEVVGISPAPGSVLGQYDDVVFDVVDDREVRNVLICVDISGKWETVYFGANDGFAPAYAASEVNPIAGGFSFVVRRAGGWVSVPSFKVLGFDIGGNQT